MEAVHCTYRRPWISDLININEFLQGAHLALAQKVDMMEELHSPIDERMLRFYGDTEELVRREKACSSSLLDCEGEEFIELSKDFECPEGNCLETLKHQAEEMSRRNASTVYRNMVFQSCRYRYYSQNMEIAPRQRSNDPDALDFVQVEHPDVLLTVQIYRPEVEQQLQQSKSPARTPIFCVDQQFYVLGSQYLTELRDLIMCQSDANVVGEFSENPFSEDNVTFQDIYKSGFFYINGTFYNDMRDPMNKDYSKHIIEWSETARGVGPFSTAKMEETRFVDLEVQLGLPYVYQHQGHCEHMIVFSELRLLNSKDPQNLMDYPLIQLLQPKKPVFCMACLMYVAKWIVHEDRRLAEVPYFFCDKCFESFNYNSHGNKTSDFKAYKYLDKTAIFGF